MTVVPRQGNSNLGRPIRDEAPAPRMMTPKGVIFSFEFLVLSRGMTELKIKN
jgi:hypothetical protein